MFGSPSSGSQSGGPCLLEPEVGALFPNNWLRPRFVFSPANSSQNLFELRLHTPNNVETNDLVVYTTSTSWTMPKAMWTQLAGHVQDSPIEVTVRGMSSTGGTPALGTTGTITIAPAPAGGSMVYWASSTMALNALSTELQGFHVGDESTVMALATTQVQETVYGTTLSTGQLSTTPTQVICIGCHTATPDPSYVAFNAQWPWPAAIASVNAMTVGQTPMWLSMSAQTILSPDRTNVGTFPAVQKLMLGIQTFSKSHFTNGDRIMITTEGSAYWTPPPGKGNPQASNVIAELAWFNLETSSTMQGTGWDLLPRTDDVTVNGQTCPGGQCSAAAPSWSHDGNHVAYVSTDTGAEDGRIGAGNADIKIVPYGAKQGGKVTPVPGASDPAYNEYYPAFSPDDQVLAFNRVGAGLSMYTQPQAEVFVVTPGGATAVRLAANDPVACSGQKSPGVQNTWPKWSPTVTSLNGKTYYWLIFSSKRAGTGNTQLYVTGVVVEGGRVSTYPAIYMWNQDPTINNEIPAWDNIEIPKIAVQ
jgi:hypothetical protein